MKVDVGTCHTGSNLISWKCPHPKRRAFYQCRSMHDVCFGCETNSSNIGVTCAEFYTNHHKFMQKPARLVQDGEKKVTFEKKARPTGKKQLRQNNTGRTELKRCTRVFEILGAFKILRQHGSWSSAWVFKIWVRFVIGTTVMRAFTKESHRYTRFQGITLQTCAIHLVMPHATMLCPRVFKMANLTLTDQLTDPEVVHNKFN